MDWNYWHEWWRQTFRDEEVSKEVKNGTNLLLSIANEKREVNRDLRSQLMSNRLLRTMNQEERSEFVETMNFKRALEEFEGDI